MEYQAKDIRLLSTEELESWTIELGHPRFRAKQIFEWIWKKRAKSFDSMQNLPKGLREQLKMDFVINSIKTDTLKVSKDKTHKCTFLLHDDAVVEGVLIPSGKRMTACISSQAGCPLACKFCATGHLGYTRNLDAYEMVEQVWELESLAIKEFGLALSNIVYMGMGEPLLNTDAVFESLNILSSPEFDGRSPQRITLSTVGIPDGIRRFTDEKISCQLAVSLHAASNDVRDELIPVNKKHDLQEISSALKYYHAKTGNRIVIEYLLFDSINDDLQSARNLAAFCRSFPVKVNIIEYNAVEESGLRAPNPMNTEAFVEFLQSLNMVVNVRRSRGADIDAACGQLAARHKK